VPLPGAHAHNDYEHARPLFDALDRGFGSVEADVWLVEGRLLVAHDLKDAKPGTTLQALYLDPLKDRIEKNGGRVYPGGPSVTLLVDVKSDATNSYLALRDALKPYGKILTRFHTNQTDPGAITVIVSGNRARELMAGETLRLAAYDGRLPDLETAVSPHLIPLVSDNWVGLFVWKGRPGDGPLPENERTKLRRMVERTHQQGRRLRLWGAPDNVAAWRELRNAGVDLINTDDLEGLKNFLTRPDEGRN
jgi:hypothetical protein